MTLYPFLYFRYLVLVFLTSFSTSSFTNFSVEQHLNFGKIAIVDNSAVSILRILSNGTQNADPNFIILEPGTVGRYFLYDYPASTELTIAIVADSTLANYDGGTAQGSFNIIPYLDFSTYTTNIHGELTLLVPGVLETTGNNLPLLDGIYYRFFEITISY